MVKVKPARKILLARAKNRLQNATFVFFVSTSKTKLRHFPTLSYFWKSKKSLLNTEINETKWYQLSVLTVSQITAFDEKKEKCEMKNFNKDLDIKRFKSPYLERNQWLDELDNGPKYFCEALCESAKGKFFNVRLWKCWNQ